MEPLKIILMYLDKRIEEHNNRINKAIETGNHHMKTLCKAERAEASIIREKVLQQLE